MLNSPTMGQIEMPTCDNIPRSVETALQEQAQAIWDAYYTGQKSSARAMLNGVPEKRKLYVGMWVYIFATMAGEQGKGYILMCSVTE